MKLIEKIQNIRLDLLREEIKQTGKNTYAGYEYFELNDFLNPLNRLMAKYKMTAIPSFNKDEASLTAYDFESDETITITSPMGTANLKGCHEVQNIGAVETYQRRYLYLAMFDISESDILNKTQGKDDKKRNAEDPQPAATCPKCGGIVLPAKTATGKLFTPEDILSTYGMCRDCYEAQKKLNGEA